MGQEGAQVTQSSCLVIPKGQNKEILPSFPPPYPACQGLLFTARPSLVPFLFPAERGVSLDRHAVSIGSR